MKIQLLTSLFLMLTMTSPIHAQEAENSELYQKIMWLDNQLFEQGFNQCKLPVFEKYIAEDLEFFHDIGGTQNKKQFMVAVQKNICSNPDGKPIRTLTAGSTQVFALKNNGVLYGAIQQGQHTFHIKGADLSKAGYTNAKFTNIWLLRNGMWQLKSALSFDHQQAFKNTKSKPINQKVGRVLLKLFEVKLSSFIFSLYFKN
jgi:hypothetical protein